MSRRRGQLRKRGPKKYLVRVYLGRIDGKRKYSAKTVHGSKKKAEQVLTKMLREVDAGTYVEPCDKPLAELLDEWLEGKKNSVSASTHGAYKNVIRLHIKPGLGHHKLHQLSSPLVQKFYNSLTEEKDLSPRYVRKIHSVLHQALKKARAWRLIKRNPADTDLIELPKREQPNHRIFSKEEVVEFLDATEGDRFHALWALLLSTGLRPSEALALKWEDIDDEGWMSVRRGLTLADYERGAHEVTTDLKTRQSKRRIKLPEFLLEILNCHRREQAKRIMIAGHRFERNDFVFANGAGTFWDINKVRRRFKKALKKAGLPEEIRLYDTRHTHISHLLTGGVNLKLASARAGHSSIQLTADTYGHVTPESEEYMANTVDQLYGSTRKDGTNGS